MKWLVVVSMTSFMTGCAATEVMKNSAALPQTNTESFAQVLEKIEQESLTIKPAYELANVCIAAMGGSERLNTEPKLTARQIADFTAGAIEKAPNPPPLLGTMNLMDHCISSAVRSLNDGSDYLTNDAFFNDQPLGSVGIEMKQVDHKILVSPLPTYAIRKQLKSGSTLLAISGESVNAAALDEVVRKLRGKVGTVVELTVIKPGDDEATTIVAQREISDRRHSFQVQDLENGNLYVGITSVYSQTCADIADQISKRKGVVPERVILDLRNNSGGMLSEIVGCASLYLAKDATVGHIKGRSEINNMTLKTIKGDYIRRGVSESAYEVPAWMKSVPLVVLVNDYTASGAAWFALALQEYKRGKVVGVKTFANGKLHTIYPMHTGKALKLHVGTLYSPAWVSVDEEGVKPDIAFSKAEYEDGVSDEIVGFSSQVNLDSAYLK